MAVTVAVAGLGSRGRRAYAPYALDFPQEMQVTAVADILPERVEEAAKTFGIPPDRCFPSVEALVAQERLADILFLCTPDRVHVPPAIPALRKGYHLLLEKPISPSEGECEEILRVAEEEKRHVVVCHVLRYTAFYQKIKELIQSGAIGDPVTFQAVENVGYYHQAHSFVRGNWRNSEETSPMILQKCCHDMDILLWLADKHLRRVSSYGTLMHFRPACAPAGAAKRCLDGCAAKDQCPYDAEKIYITDEETGVRHVGDDWPVDVLALHPTEESVMEALRTGPYGRCVYHCDNNVVDHQVVNLELDGGVTASLTMSAFTSRQFRQLKVMGTLGDISADTDTNLITLTRFGREPEVIDVRTLTDDFSGHGGGDRRLVRETLRLVSGGEAPGTALTSLEASIESHRACFAAEYSRLHGGESVDVEAFFRTAGDSTR